LVLNVRRVEVWRRVIGRVVGFVEEAEEAVEEESGL
jgi:hypothetical protein